MNPNILIKTILNFSAVLLLIALIAAPVYFAKNFAQVAGVKSEAPYLLVSQVEKFPGISFSQEDNKYQISLNRQFPSQAFLSVLILTNPTNQTKTYVLQQSEGSTKIFFSEDFQNPANEIRAPANSATPISLLTEGETPSVQTIEFTIETK